MKLIRGSLLMAALAGLAGAQIYIDAQIGDAIAKIKAIDNHAHPVRVVLANDKDTEYDALPVEVMEPYTEPVRTREGTSLAIEAWSGLFGYRYNDRAPDHVRELRDLKKQYQRDKGDGYSAWVLDQLGIESMLANRVAMGRGLVSPRFLWVPFADALMYPLNNSSLAAKNPDYKTFYDDEDRLLKRYLKDSGYSAPPAMLDEYLQKVVTPTLERQKRGGAIAVKF